MVDSIIIFIAYYFIYYYLVSDTQIYYQFRFYRVYLVRVYAATNCHTVKSRSRSIYPLSIVALLISAIY